MNLCLQLVCSVGMWGDRFSKKTELKEPESPQTVACPPASVPVPIFGVLRNLRGVASFAFLLL